MSRNLARDMVQKSLGKKLDEPKTFYGHLGNNNNIVNVPGQPDYVYVRLNDGSITTAYNMIAPSIVNLPVVCGYDVNQPSSSLLKIISVRNIPRRSNSGVLPNASYVASHHAAHEWLNRNGGSDIVYMELRQFTPLRPEPVYPMSIKINRGILNIDSTWKYIDTQTIPLENYIPRSGSAGALESVSGSAVKAKFVLISLEAASGSGVVTDGDEKYVYSLALSDIPATPLGNYPICAVRLYYYQTVINESYITTDIIDLRWGMFTNGEVIDVGSVLSQYILHSLSTAENDFLVGSGSSAFMKKTLAETISTLAHHATHESGGADEIRDATNALNGLMPAGKLDEWNAAHAHISSNGSSHSFIDQDLRKAAEVDFAGLDVRKDDYPRIVMTNLNGVYRKAAIEFKAAIDNNYFYMTSDPGNNGEAYFAFSYYNGSNYYSYFNVDAPTASDILYIKGNKVGINNNNPGEALDVIGNIATSGSVTVGGNLTLALTQGSIPFIGAGGVVIEDNDCFFYSNDNGGQLAVGDNSGMRNVFQAVKEESTTNIDTVKSLVVARNKNTTNNTWAGFSWQTKDVAGNIHSGARIMTEFKSHAENAITADMVFDTRHAGTRSEKMRLSSEGNLTIEGTVDGIDVATDVAANTVHRGSDGKNHADVVLNNAHRAVVSGNPHVVTAADLGIAASSGWTAGEVWTYASVATFTVAGDVRTKYPVGTKLKLTQTTDKYFYVASTSYSDPNTTITITAGTLYTLANAAITSPCFSYQTTPQGFPQWFPWTPVYGGFSSDPTHTCRFCIIGRTLRFSVHRDGDGTSNADSFTMTFPVAAASTTRGGAVALPKDNGANKPAGVWYMAAASSTMYLYLSTHAVWTNSGAKAAYFDGAYEI